LRDILEGELQENTVQGVGANPHIGSENAARPDRAKFLGIYACMLS